MTDAETQASGGERRCRQCGAELASNAAFCRACGARYEPPAAVAPPPVAPPPMFPPPVSPPPPTPPAYPDEGRSRGRVVGVLGALIVLVAAGVAVAVIVGKGTGSNGTTVTTTIEQSAPSPDASAEEQAEAEATEASEAEDTEAAATEAEAEAEARSEAEVEEVSATMYPEVSRARMDQEVTSLLERYHQDVVEEDFRGAWAMLSPRKRRQYLREYGFHGWAKAQATLSPYLHPGGLRADVVALEGEGEARVDVTGMGWSKSGSSCSEWSGLTWVKYEDGEWSYDPGYSTTAARRSAWKSRYPRLLGGDCSE